MIIRTYPKIEYAGYVKHLVTKKEVPINGCSRKRPAQQQRFHLAYTDTIVLKDSIFQKYKHTLLNGEPYEVYYDYNIVRKSINERHQYKHSPYKMLSDKDSIVNKFVTFIGKRQRKESNHRGHVYWVLRLKTLDNFEAMKLSKHYHGRMK